MRRLHITLAAVAVAAALVAAGVYVAMAPGPSVVLPKGTLVHFRLGSQTYYMVRYNLSRAGRLVGSWTAGGGLQVLALQWNSDTPPAVSFPTPPWPRNGTFNQGVSPGGNAIVFYPDLYLQPSVNLTVTQTIEVVYS